MQTQVRPPRQRSSSGRTLMLLGLVLALAAAAIVFYITSTVQGTLSQTVSVVAAQTNLKAGTILTLNNAVAPSMRIQDAFAVKQIDKKLAPPDAFIFTNQDALNTALNNQVVKEDFLSGDVLRNNDPRLAPVGATSGTSLTNINPPALKPGQVLFVMSIDNADYGVQPGDTIDIILTAQEANPPAGAPPNSTISQTTLANIPVYAVDVPAKGKIIVVVSNQDAVYLAEMERSGFQLTIVIRKPGDTTQPTTAPVDNNSLSTRWFGKG
jgi:Flp pilus assembly protein CpaB